MITSYIRTEEEIKKDIEKINYVLENFKNTKTEINQFNLTKRELQKELFYAFARR